MQIINEEQVNACLTSIELEIEKAEFEPCVNSAYKTAAKQINVPGFRKGKAPRFMLKQYVEPKYIAEYAAEEFVEKNFDKIIELSGKKPYAQCTFDVVDCDPEGDGPVTIKFNIPTEPVVKLGEYKGIEAKKYVKEVTDEDIEKQLDEIIAQRTKITPVLDRPAAKEDSLFLDVTDTDAEEPKAKPERYVVGKGTKDMDKAVIGMEQGDEKDVTVKYPKSYSDKDLAGQTKNYHIKVRNIYNNVTPELNDEFIAEMFKSAPALPEGEEYPKTVEEFRSYSKKHMQEELNKQFDEMFKSELINKLVECSDIQYPEAMLNQRVQDAINRFSNYLKQSNMKMEDYMKAYQLTPNMMVEEFKKREDIELKKSLVGAELVKAENLKASDEEMEAAIKEKAEQRNSTPEAFKEMVDKNEYFKTMIEDEIVSKKIMDVLIENAKVNEEVWDEEKMMAEQMAQQIEAAAEQKKEAEEKEESQN